jgi:hypothetical protein
MFQSSPTLCNAFLNDSCLLEMEGMPHHVSTFDCRRTCSQLTYQFIRALFMFQILVVLMIEKSGIRRNARVGLEQHLFYHQRLLLSIVLCTIDCWWRYWTFILRSDHDCSNVERCETFSNGITTVNNVQSFLNGCVALVFTVDFCLFVVMNAHNYAVAMWRTLSICS